jgi:hypothetical protein
VKNTKCIERENMSNIDNELKTQESVEPNESLGDKKNIVSKLLNTKLKKIIAIIIAVLLLAGISFGIYSYIKVSASNNFDNVLTQRDQAKEKLYSTIGTATQTLNNHKDKAKDQKVIDSLNSAIRFSKDLVIVNIVKPTSITELNNAINGLNLNKDAINTSIDTLETSLDAFKKENITWTKTEGQNSVNSAEKLLKDSEGDVADNQTREILQKAINTLKDRLKKQIKHKQIGEVLDLVNKVSIASNDVSASINLAATEQEAAAQRTYESYDDSNYSSNSGDNAASSTTEETTGEGVAKSRKNLCDSLRQRGVTDYYDILCK